MFQYSRRCSSPVRIGQTPLGGANPIRIQSMTNTSTMDTEGSVAQCKRIIDAGADYVRLTAQGVREAANLALIREVLRKDGYKAPLVADIHFNPKAADEAATSVEKVRINPGNYVDPVKTFAHFEYTDEEYARELQKIHDRFVPFLTLCKSHGTAVRIGVNHGSLSDRIMSRYGDTPAGMVESCLEFLRLCVEENFPDVVISIKASNVLVMVQTVRLLVHRMDLEGMYFPLHLGVTEAGDGEDGRIKSAAGIGTLLIDGIGDTIRVSLSEDPEREIPVAQRLLDILHARVGKDASAAGESLPLGGSLFDPFEFHRRQTDAVGSFGGGQVPQVLLDLSNSKVDFNSSLLKPDFVYVGTDTAFTLEGIPRLCDASCYRDERDTYPVFSVQERELLQRSTATIKFVRLTPGECSPDLIRFLMTVRGLVLMVRPERSNRVAEWRSFFQLLSEGGCRIPVVLVSTSDGESLEEEQLTAGMDFGPMLLDGFGDGLLMMEGSAIGGVTPLDHLSILFGVLQSTRLRISRTEYISCPSCGRTLFDLQKVIAQIKARTSHLKGLKIGIMGCIVNGPGEMADADYGYVGAGRGLVSLYKGQLCVEKNIPAEMALERLLQIIRLNGDWMEPIGE
jgi:(E)-4-hydroxy-3-methylbut-2-enyl-diphosphate synthase